MKQKRIHHKIKDLICQVCDYSAPTAGEIKRHIHVDFKKGNQPVVFLRRIPTRQPHTEDTTQSLARPRRPNR